MNKYRIILSLSVLLCTVLSSCGDSFFEQPRPLEPAFKDTRTFEMLVSEAYYRTNWQDMTRGNEVAFDLLASNAVQQIGTDAVWMLNNIYQHQYTTIGNRKGPWQQCYMAVFNCNLGLELDREGNGNPFKLNTASTDYINNYQRQIGELYFLRAYAYYYMARWYAPPYNEANKSQPGIVLTTNPATTQEEVNNLKLGTVGETYDQIVKDLLEAERILPDKIVRSDWNTYTYFECGRANKYVAKTLLAKIYFQMGNFNEAKKRLNEVIAATQHYSLSTDITDPFTNNDRNHRVPENILEYNTGDPSNGSSNRDRLCQVFYTGNGLGYRQYNNNWGGGNDVLNPDGSPLISLPLSNSTRHTVSYHYLRLMEWMEPDKGNTYTRDANATRLKVISSDTAITAMAKGDLRFQHLFRHTKGLKTSLTQPPRKSSFPAERDLSKMTKEEWDARYLECLAYDPNEGASAKLFSSNSQVVYIDKYYRGPCNFPFAANFTKYPIFRLAELHLIRAWILQSEGDKAAAARDLNLIWNRANPSNQDRYNAGNTDDNAVFAEFCREMMGEGHFLEFMFATKRVIPKGDNEYSTVTDEPYPYTQFRFAIPKEEIDINQNIEPVYYSTAP